MTTPKLTLKHMFQYWKQIRLHRKWVRYYCRLAGIRWRGWKHDLSKYSPTEFFENARFYDGKKSPVETAKSIQGYSRAWLHHRGRNTHHWAYWADEFSEGLIVYPMPRDDFVEMVCDFLGAAHAYTGERFSYSAERAWWVRERDRSCKAMHEKNKIMLDIIFSDLEFASNHMIEGCPTSLITSTPESLIKSGYLQEVWRANTI